MLNQQDWRPGAAYTFQAAAYLNLSRRRLDRYRTEGNGPRFRKFGQKVVYTIADLDAWSAQHIHQTTHEPGYPTAPRRDGGSNEHAS